MVQFERGMNMTRHRYTAAEREAIWFSADGQCHLCRMAIAPGEDWEVSHVDIPAEHGGDEVAPAHYRCHKVETATVTLPTIAKVRNVRQRHNGAREAKVKMPCGRHSSRSKGMDGRVKTRIRGSQREAALRAERANIDYQTPPLMRQIRSEP
jgi:hypothetical protein